MVFSFAFIQGQICIVEYRRLLVVSNRIRPKALVQALHVKEKNPFHLCSWKLLELVCPYRMNIIM